MWYLRSLAAFAALAGFATAHPRPFDSGPRSLAPRGPIINCKVFSPTGNNPEESLMCREYVKGGYPKVIGGRKVDLYRYTDGWDPNDETTISHLASIGDALEAVLPLYETFGVGFDLIVIFSKTLPKDEGEDDYGYEEEASGTTSPCYVRIQNAVPGHPADVGLSLQQTIAHETYHCVEDANRAAELPDVANNGWWLEGVPEFYSAEFYPGHDDDSYPRQYDPAIPLYRQDYPVGLFFVYLHGYGWDYTKINNLVFHVAEAASPAQARKLMSAYSEIRTDFPSFAQAFINNLITYSDGSLVDPVKQRAPIRFEPLNLPEGGSNNWIVKAPTYTIYTFGLALDPGQSFTITWKPSSKFTTLYYRKSPDTDWIDITTEPASIALTCDDGTTIYEFLFTCTADTDQGTGVLSFLQINKQNCCTGTATASSCSTNSPTPASPPSTTPANPSGTPSDTLDPCLRGTWNMDLAAMQNLLQSKLSDLPAGETVSNIKVTGAATFAVPATGSTSTFTFSHTDINYDITATSFTGHTLVDIDGKSTATVVMGTTGNFAWKNVQSTGLVKTTTTTSVTADPIEFDVDVGDQYGTAIAVNYICTASTLVMNGVQSGTRQWSYSFTKA